MDAQQNLAKNLSQLRTLLHMSLEEMAQDLVLPKSTLQSILKSGNTTANTLFHISQHLHISVDALLGNDFSDDFLTPLEALLPFFNFYSALPAERKVLFRIYLSMILGVLQK